MAQFIAFVVFLIIAKLLVDFIKEKFSFAVKNKNSKSGDVIDISDAWVDAGNLPYKRKEQVINSKERSFYQTLSEIFSGYNYVIFPHMQMSELISVTESPKHWEYLQRLKERTLDMVILEASSFKPVLVFNLQETEAGKSKQISNRFTTQALLVAGLPMISINLNQMPKPQELIKELRKHGLNISSDS